MSWLPSFSVEVTRVRPDAALAGAQLDAAAAQLQLMFPQYSRAALAGDLARTRSADLTLDNILEGRLPPPAGTQRHRRRRRSHLRQLYLSVLLLFSESEMLAPEPAALPEASPEPEPAPVPEPVPAPVPTTVAAAVLVDASTLTAPVFRPILAAEASGTRSPSPPPAPELDDR